VGTGAITARPEILDAVRRAAPNATGTLRDALRYALRTKIASGALAGQLAEARYFRWSNRIASVVFRGELIKDADTVYEKVVRKAPPGGHAPVIDFTIVHLRSRNPLVLLLRKLQGKPIVAKKPVSLLSAKAGRDSYAELIDFFRRGRAFSVTMEPKWGEFVTNQERKLRAVTTNETMARIKQVLGDKARLRATAGRVGLTQKEFTELLEQMRDARCDQDGGHTRRAVVEGGRARRSDLARPA